MLRNVFLVFIAGWVLWFWIDKPPVGLAGLPHPSENMVDNFQRAFDILKSGHLKIAWLYIWDAHYLVLSILGGLLLSAITGTISNQLARRRLRKHFLPPQRRKESGADGNSPSEPARSPPKESLVRDKRVE
jgi:hypothetical protein